MNETQLETLAQQLAGRLWRNTILPALALQLIVSGGMSLVLAGKVDAAWHLYVDEESTATATATVALPDDVAPPSPAQARSDSDSLAEVASAEEVTDSAISTAASPIAAAATLSVAPTESTTTTPPVTAGPDPVSKTIDEVRELSVQPQTKPLLPADRPAWVGSEPDLSSKDHRLFVGSFPMSSVAETDEALDTPMVEALYGYLSQHVIHKGDARKLTIDSNFVRNNLLSTAPTYLAELSTHEGSMYQKWVVLKVSPEQRDYFVEQFDQVLQRERATELGVVLLGLLSITGLANLGFQRFRRRTATAPMRATIVSGPAVGGAGPAAPKLVSLPVLNKPVAKKKKACCTQSNPLVVLTILAIVCGTVWVKRRVDTAHPIDVATPIVAEPEVLKGQAAHWPLEAKLKVDKVKVDQVVAEAKKAMANVEANVEASIEQAGKMRRTRIAVGHGDKFIEITHDSVADKATTSDNVEKAAKDDQQAVKH